MRVESTEQRLISELFSSTVVRVAGYVRRHVAVDDVDDVLADTYLIAWRRRDRLDVEDPVPWLLVTARNVIANRRRLRSRSEVFGVDLATVASIDPRLREAEDTVVRRDVALAALADLSEREREAVLLVAWDGLDHAAAAFVAGCSVRAFTVRLHRARMRLQRSLDADPQPGPATVCNAKEER